MKSIIKTKTLLATGVLTFANFVLMGTAEAHCDGLYGPVIIEARSAIEKKDVTSLLKWVPGKDELEVKEAFAKTLRERADGKATPETADRKLFETLVRIHRESEGASFTGIKAAGQIAPVVREADSALEKGNVDRLAKQIAAKLEQSIRDKFEKTVHNKEHAGHSVEKGREFVGNYVQYVHFVEELNALAERPAGHHEEPQKASAHKH